MLKKKKKMHSNCLFKRKLGLFGRNGTRQAKNLIFIMVPKILKVKKLKEMLLEPSFIME